jgi:SAM-dependent methyltransferase
MAPAPPQPPGTAPPACPLCGATGAGTRIWSVPTGAIWAALAAEWEVRIPAEVALRHTAGAETALVRCGECGLQSFRPAVAGDGDFYAALAASPRYYDPWKWEYGWVGERLAPGAAVLDVGCGSGNFLASVAPRLRRAAGLEKNPVALAAAAARGLEVSGAGIEEFAREHAGAFDAACLFHVLEHLPAVAPFLRSLLACLRPGGSLFVSVPDRERSLRLPLEPLDCPPHHLSRWSAADLRALAPRFGLRLEALAAEPVDARRVATQVPQRLRRRLEALPLGGAAAGLWAARILVRTVFHPLLCEGYRRVRLFDRLGMRGNSLVAWYVARGGEGQ